MKKYFVFILILICQKFQAQITINSSHMPSNGDTIRFSNAQLIGGNINFTQTGTNYNWNFTNLSPISQDVYKFQPLTSTPYATLAFTGMPIGAIGYKVADSIGTGQAGIKNVYNFFEKNQTSWRAVGTGFTLSAVPFPAGGVYSDKDEIYTFPLRYLDDDSTTFAVTTNLGNQFLSLGKFIQKGSRKTTVDGWGTISTPYANNVSCLRVKSIIYEFDSISVPNANINFGFNTVRVEYKWLSTSEKIPMLEVSGSLIGNTFTPNSIRYRDIYRATPVNPLLPTVKFTVNKTTGNTNLDTFTFTNTSTPNVGVSYSWAINSTQNNFVPTYVKNTTSTSKNPSVVFANNGIYNVKLTATNLAGSKDSTALNMITIGNNSSIGSIISPNFIYPIPAQNEINFLFNNLIGKTYFIYDLNGKIITQGIVNETQKINVENLPSNQTYYIIVNDNETLLINKFLKI